MKQIKRIQRGPAMHWVGDGFPVRTFISPSGAGVVGPFILMDYAGPFTFEPATTPRGVDSHPHKGFETVTVVFQGELEHRDSAGNSGSIGPGDVQWMTAGSGVLHEEKHSERFTMSGGDMEMAQLWVNLPAKDKGVAPQYQTLVADEIPSLTIGSSVVRLIAGNWDDHAGAARTFTKVLLWTIDVAGPATLTIPIPEGYDSAIYVRRGEVTIGEEAVGTSELVTFELDDAGVELSTTGPTQLLVLGGEPINEPIAAYGPFVMNSQTEIAEAIREFQSGKYGSL
jgi:redox-sensitive bicupin YhaK (pirin superfamily)